jgi:fatty acid amide hydrolase 2
MSIRRAIVDGEVSVREVVDAHVEHIQRVNPAINAVVVQRFEQAREAADDADRRLRSERWDVAAAPPLLGLPFTVKEYVEVAGAPLSAGIWSRRDVRGQTDATIVRRLLDAGAILVGTTNVPEGGLWMETDNRVYGRTVNPWDRERTCGGSSGGEGAIVASGGVAFGLGADVGGSIRIPAAFCGTVGHKPTGRMVPNTGYWPEVHGELSAYLVCGPLVRRTEDVMPLMRVLSGPDGADHAVRAWELGDPTHVDLRDVTVFPVPGNGFTRVSRSYRNAIDEAARALQSRGATIGRLDPKRLRRAFMIWAAMMATGGGDLYAEVLGDGTPIRVRRELLRSMLGRSKHTLPALVIAGAELLANRVPGELDKAVAHGRALQKELEELLGPRGVLLHPPYSRPAPRHYRAMLTPLDFVCTGLFNVLEFPSTVVPMGHGGAKVPLSVQVIARRGNDHLTVAVAGALEDAFGGWRRAEPDWRLDAGMLGPRSLVG